MNEVHGKAAAVEIRPPKYTGSISCSEKELPDEFVRGIKELEVALGMPVLMVVQHDEAGLWNELYDEVFEHRHELPQSKPVAVLIDSPGGDARATYKLAKLLIACCGEYHAVVPRYAKSAATLLSLGAKSITLGAHAELGPLDVQVMDPESEKVISALDHVQTLERLSAFAMRTLDQGVFLMLQRSGKKVSSVLPLAMRFSAALVRPLMERIDAVKYTEMSRLLRIGEAYAERLLRPIYREHATDIAARLVGDYPEHGFVIDHVEACEAGLAVELPKTEVATAFTKLMPHFNSLTVVGMLKEKQSA